MGVYRVDGGPRGCSHVIHAIGTQQSKASNSNNDNNNRPVFPTTRWRTFRFSIESAR
jgi:hypothetical protein